MIADKSKRSAEIERDKANSLASERKENLKTLRKQKEQLDVSYKILSIAEQKAQEQTRRAEESKRETDTQAQIASMERHIAKIAKDDALEQKRVANEARDKAIENEEKAKSCGGGSPEES